MRVWLVFSLSVVLCGVIGFIIGDNHSQIINVFKPTAIPTFAPTVTSRVVPPTAIPTSVPTAGPLVVPPTDPTDPYCDTKKFTAAYRDYINKWVPGDTQSTLNSRLDAIETPTEIRTQCGEIQAHLIQRLEFTAREGVPYLGRGEVMSFKRDMMENISDLEYFER